MYCRRVAWDYRGQRKIIPLGQWLLNVVVDAYVAPNVVLAGQVTVWDGASVWLTVSSAVISTRSRRILAPTFENALFFTPPGLLPQSLEAMLWVTGEGENVKPRKKERNENMRTESMRNDGKGNGSDNVGH
ncbi:hypothetical protein Fmac_006722 [Flemingia macrophylla]|uniref:Uncharacterized protein n=1 Tax=Flemingia macrophylla TaxID=520843 RepID=A0ABD1NCL7_9FABA